MKVLFLNPYKNSFIIGILPHSSCREKLIVSSNTQFGGAYSFF